MPVCAALVTRKMSAYPGGDDAKPDGIVAGRRDGLEFRRSASENKGAPLTDQNCQLIFKKDQKRIPRGDR
jgi:hypothetical protein